MAPPACVTGIEPPFYGFLNHNPFSLCEEGPRRWSTFKSSSLYQVDAWGAPYFYVNESGNMAVRPHGTATDPNEEIDLMEVIQKVVEAMPGPLIIRFPDILKHRLETIQTAFDNSILIHNYQRRFQGVFPVKCNQDRFVVEDIVEFGKPYSFGLEVGSKPELLMAMACLCKGSADALLICNGYKDSEYVGLALTARQLGFNSVIVLEQAEEVEFVIRMSRHFFVRPVIGVRAKLHTTHGGHFGETSGENGKFGLTCVEMLCIMQKLRRVGMLDCLQLLHFHIGSQIPSLRVLNDSVTEAAHIYCELALMGANMNYIDVGGGLGINYDGSSSPTSDMSVAYTIEEYAAEVVIAVKNACMLKEVKQPILCSESGRALVSHHSVLAFNVLSYGGTNADVTTDLFLPFEVDRLPKNLSLLYTTLGRYKRVGDYEKSLECVKRLKVEAIELFKKGQVSLELLAYIKITTDRMCETSRRGLCQQRKTCLDQKFRAVETECTAVYQINLSIFKSMPDTWAIGQIFPTVPLHRLEEQPTVRAILSDITCDSDGKISNFIGTDGRGNRSNHLLLHPPKADEPYFVGMFLGGAYQEALGGLHNMFGNPTVIHVARNRHFDTPFQITRAVEGQTAAEVLSCMQHEPHGMLEILKRRVEEYQGKKAGGGEAAMGEAERRRRRKMMESLECIFQSTPYLKMEGGQPHVLSSHVRTK